MKHECLCFSAYQEVCDYLNSSSMFSIKLGLDRIKHFLSFINNPQDKITTVHIAGTNGKGSVLKYLESVLDQSGYRVGTFTSPHLVNYTERICINSSSIPETDFLNISNQLFEILKSINNSHLTQFEFLTVLAFKYFYDSKTDINIIETGLGGRFDATNVISKPICSVITSLDIDHKEYLGDTIEKIAFEKAGIIKPNSNLIVNKANKGLDVLASLAKDNNTAIHLADSEQYKSLPDIKAIKQKVINTGSNLEFSTSLLGEHQLENISLAIKAIDLLKDNNFIITDEQVKLGINKTYWPGRTDYIKDKNILLDGAHNPAGALALRKIIDTYFADSNITWLVGILNTKDALNILKNLVRTGDKLILTQIKAPNTIKSNDLYALAVNNNLTSSVIKTDSLDEALNYIDDNFLTVIAGSLYLVGEYYSLNGFN